MRELSSAPQGHLFELLVLPGAERRGNQEFAAQLAHSPRSGAEGKPGVRCSTRAFPPERSGGGNDTAHLPGPLLGQNAARNQNAAPVRCSGWFGVSHSVLGPIA